MTDPRVRVVTLTITEGGYDVATAPEGNAFGYLCEALRRRRAAGSPPFAVLSCDNIEANGDIARAAVTGWVFAALTASFTALNAACVAASASRALPRAAIATDICPGRCTVFARLAAARGLPELPLFFATIFVPLFDVGDAKRKASHRK
jgi:hypothetical protein